MVWLYVPGLEGWSLPSTLSSEQATEPSVSLRGTLCKPESLRRAWKTGRSIRRLSGMTLPPSTANAGVDAWILSLPVSHANRSVLRGSDSDSPMNAGYGRILRESFGRFDRDSCSWKTFPDLFGTVCEVSPETWSKAGSLRNGIVSRLPKSARRISGNGFSFWPTATGNGNHNVKGMSPKSGDGLATAAIDWPTPAASKVSQDTNMTKSGDDRTTPNKLGWAVADWPTPDAQARRQNNTSPGPAGSRPTLALSVESWQTPTSHMHKETGAPSEAARNSPPLTTEAAQWATPRAEDSERTGAHRGTPDTLTSQTDLWQTPATDSFRSRGGDRKDEPGLDQQARMWPTPTADDASQVTRDSGTFQSLTRTAVAIEATAPHSRQDETTAKGGPRTSAPVVLNPRFVEALMGLPDGMTDSLAPVTELSRWRRRMRSLLWLIVSA
jgi:hypothetical protein